MREGNSLEIYPRRLFSPVTMITNATETNSSPAAGVTGDALPKTVFLSLRALPPYESRQPGNVLGIDR